MTGRVTLIGLLTLGLCHAAWANCNAPAAKSDQPWLPHVTAGPSIDGTIEPDAWRSALTLPLTVETRPAENTPADTETTVLLMENGSHLFVAFRAYDPHPEQIRAYLRDRDSAWDDDFVGIALDTFNDKRQAFEFFANPLGAQMDLIYDDVNDNEDDAWDAIWDSAGTITATGYEVEMAIPLAQLRFPDSDGTQTWGLDAVRFHPRDKRRRLSIHKIDRNVDCYLCQFTSLEGFACSEPGRNLLITPTLTAQSARSREDPVTEALSSRGDAEAGLDVRWGITPNLVLSTTFNPDFSQVEADVAQLEVNEQFALFFPESRPFFLESADFFASDIQAVFTRNVADPDLGIKLIGKHGRNGFGAFAAQDTRTNLLIPGRDGSDTETLAIDSQATVGRYRRDVGRNSSLGALFTSRSADAYRNTVAGVDGNLQLSNSNTLDFQYLRSSTRYPTELAEDFDQPAGSFSSDAWTASFNHRSRNWQQYTIARDFGRDFRADLGFIPRVDYRQLIIGGARKWYPGTRWDKVELRGDWDITYDHNGELQERETEARIEIEGPWQSELESGIGFRDRRFEGTLFAETFGFTYAELNPRAGLFLALLAQYGDRIDFDNARLGKLLALRPEVRWNIGLHLLLRIRHSFSQLETDDTSERIFRANLSDVRITWQFNVRSFLRLVLLHEDVARNQAVFSDPIDGRSRELGTQLLYSYKINPQSVLFAGYSSNAIDGDDLRSFESTDETFFLKIGYAFLP